MDSIVVERDTSAAHIFAVIMFFFSIVYFYVSTNMLAIIVPLGLVGFIYWLVSIFPLEYFWASNEGIEFHIRKNEVILVPWQSIIDISLGRDLDTQKEMIVIKLDHRLKRKPLYVECDSGFFNTHANSKLHLKLGKKNIKILNEMIFLKEKGSV